MKDLEFDLSVYDKESYEDGMSAKYVGGKLIWACDSAIDVKNMPTEFISQLQHLPYYAAVAILNDDEIINEGWA